jgi:AcrR family transcriptional regulator
VTEGAFFHYFPAKNDVGYALADEMLKEMILDRWTRPLSAYRNPVQGMVIRFRKNMEASTDEELGLGCPVNNLTQEMSSIDPIFRDRLRAVLTAWIGETERYLRRAQAAGYLRDDVDVKEAAEFIVMVEEGSAAMVKNLGDRRVYSSLYNSFRRYLESLCVGRGAD